MRLKLFPGSRKRRITILATIAAYALLMTFGGCADFFILHPSTDPLRIAGTTRQEVPVPNAPSVEIWRSRSVGAATREPEAFVLEFVGNASRAEFMAAELADEWGHRPVEVWAVHDPG